MVIGSPGSGKSLFALMCGWLLDRDSNNRPTFSGANIVFTAAEFSKANDQNKRRVIIWEEPYSAGVKDGGANARTFMRKTNLEISQVFQQMRANNNVVLLTLPLAGAFDFQAREVAHGYVWVKENNGQFSIATYMEKKVNPILGKEYPHYMAFRHDGEPAVMKYIITPSPPKNLVTFYENKSNFYKAYWSKEITANIGKTPKNRADRLAEEKSKFILSAMEDPYQYGKKLDGKTVKLNVTKIASKHGIAHQTARNWQQAGIEELKKLGFIVANED